MRRAAGRLIVVVIVLLLAAGTAWWLARRYQLLNEQVAQIEPIPTAPISVSPAPSLTPLPSIDEAAPTPEPSVIDQLPSTSSVIDNSFVGTLKLIIPVAGVRQDQLLDTFDVARSEGRVHDAIDIPAPAGTSVLAAGDGQIIKLFQSERGGTTVYQLSADRKLVFYYAHLQGYAPNLVEGMYVRQGQVIAYVGDTGNAGTGNYHLHFSIAIVADPKRFWEGTNINPYPLLHR
ncbi:MAG TPA: M23 family metallopeptidase [Pyrinomonadaceae bacterium]|nr:M23 family metallopeptidase [Pyrinomonadaceae bacterium]